MGKVNSLTNSQKSFKKVDIKDDPAAAVDTRKKTEAEVTGLQRKETGGSKLTSVGEYMKKNHLKFQPQHALQSSMLSTKSTLRKLAPEFVYMIDSYCSCILAIFQMFLAVCLIAWQGSIQSILSDIHKLGALGDMFYNQSVETKRNMAETFANNQYHAYRSGFLTSNSLGSALIGFALISIVNTIVGWRAAMMAMRRTLIVHRYFDLPLAIMNIAAIAWGFLATDCLLEMDIIERSLMENFMNYGDKGQSDSMINRIQQALGCCGVHGPLDYMDKNIRVNLGDDNSSRKFPTSCCREWWIRNVECGSKSVNGSLPGSTLYERILFTETIQQVGCIERISEVCSLFLPLYKYGMVITFILYLVHIVIRYCTVVQMLREENAIRVRASQEVRDHARIGFPLWSGANSMESSDEDDVTLNKPQQPKYDEAWTTLMDNDGQYSVPNKSKKKVVINQDILQHYKDRAEFAEIESKLGKTFLGEWVEQARDTSHFATEREYGEDDNESPEELPEPYRANMPPQRARSSLRRPTKPPSPPRRRNRIRVPKKIEVVQEPEPEEPVPIPEEPIPKPKKWIRRRGRKGDHPYTHIVDYEHFRRMRKKLFKDREAREREQREQEKKEIEVGEALEEIIGSPKHKKRRLNKRRFKHRKTTSSTSPTNKVVPHYVLKYKPFRQRYSLRTTPVLKSVRKEQPFPRWLT